MCVLGLQHIKGIFICKNDCLVNHLENTFDNLLNFTDHFCIHEKFSGSLRDQNCWGYLSSKPL